MGAKKDSKWSGRGSNRSDGLYTVSEATARAEEGGVIPPDGQVGVGVFSSGEGMGAEHSLRCVGRQSGGVTGIESKL